MYIYLLYQAYKASFHPAHVIAGLSWLPMLTARDMLVDTYDRLLKQTGDGWKVDGSG